LASVTKIDQSYYDFYQSAEFEAVLKELELTIASTPQLIVTERNFKTENNFQKCSFPWSHFYISWDGYVPPCCAKPFPKELNFGNVQKLNVMSVLNSASYKDFRNQWYANTAPHFCKKCHLINIKPIKSIP
jgi:radical SAM protein with 4Fe4S-binding SPASM domain